MELKYGLLVLLIILLAVPVSFAALDISQPYSEIEIPYGENAVSSLPLFSRTYLRLHEGTKLDFNVVDPDTGVALIRNSIIIKEIGPKPTKVLLSLDRMPYEEKILTAGEEIKLNYTYKFMPFMFLQQIITHYDEDEEERNIVLYFNIPFLKVGKDLDSSPATGFTSLDTTQVSAGNRSKGLDPLLVVMTIVVVILVLVLIYTNIKKFRK